MIIELSERADALDEISRKPRLYLEAREELREVAKILRHLHKLYGDDWRTKAICDTEIDEIESEPVTDDERSNGPKRY